MGFLRFLSSLRTLAKNGDITIRDAYKFAQQEFGEVSDLLKLQINKIFKDADAPSIRKPEGKVIEASFKPGRDKTGKVVEESESQRLGLAGLKNPYRIGGGLDPVEGMTRTAARVVLDRKGIKVPEKGDPIDVFEENFGGDALMDLKEAGEELLEKETTGRITESMGEFLESKGLFDLKVDKTLPKGMTNEELLKKLMDEDPEEFAKGGRVGYQDGGPTKDEYGIMSLPAAPNDPNSVNDDIDRVAQLVAQSYKMGPEEQMNNKQIAYDRIEEIAEQISYGGNIDGVRSNLIDYFNDKVQEYQSMIQEFSTGGRVGFAIGGAKKVIDIIKEIKKLDPMDAMKEVNKVVGKKGDYKNLSAEEIQEIFEETNDHIFGREYVPKETDVTFDDVDAPKKRSFKGVEIKDPTFDEDLPFDNDAEKLAEIKMSNETFETEKLAPKMVERLEMKQKYPGIDEELLTFIIDDPDPIRKAKAIATLDQAFVLMKQGKSPDEILDIFKQMTDRTEQAQGGLNYLSGF